MQGCDLMDLQQFQHLHLNDAKLIFVQANPFKIRYAVQGYEVTLVETNGRMNVQTVSLGAIRFTDASYLAKWKPWSVFVYNKVKPLIPVNLIPTPTPIITPIPTPNPTPPPVASSSIVRKQLQESPNMIDEEEFEFFVWRLFKRLGYEVTLRRISDANSDNSANLPCRNNLKNII